MVLQCTLLSGIVQRTLFTEMKVPLEVALHKLHSHIKWVFLLTDDCWIKTVGFKI